jgi:hypothetical protein
MYVLLVSALRRDTMHLSLGLSWIFAYYNECVTGTPSRLFSFSTTSPRYGNYLIPSSLPVLASTLRRLFYYLYIPDVLDVALVPRLITHPIHSLTHPIHLHSPPIP